MQCVFCRIIAGEIPSQILHQDDKAIAFRDIHPQAPVHILIVPRKHLPTPGDFGEEDFSLFGHLMRIAVLLAKREGIAEKGYRLAINVAGMALGDSSLTPSSWGSAPSQRVGIKRFCLPGAVAQVVG
ncbi:MAG: HIT domain-containing protein [Anaerolineae bacterium]|nr:HIT domain-containing protein [Anaerolineae bacterium]